MSISETVDIVFQNLSYTVKDKVQSRMQQKEIKKLILDNLTGCFFEW